MKVRRTTTATLALLILLIGCAAAREQGAKPAASPAAAPNAKAAAPRTYVFVHGAWGGGWAFRRVEELLRARGHTVYRPTLTGLGERRHLAGPHVGLNTHVEDVVNVLLFEELRDVVLVGHSYGGMVITGVADRVPERIRSLVYLDAMVPADGESVLGLLGARAERMKQMEKDGLLVPPWVRPDQPPPSDVPHPFKTLTDPVVYKNEAAKRLPATYILTVEAGAKTDDFDAQAERAKARGWTILRMQADHNPQRTAPEALVELLEQTK
jgi:pimeloyl-ACP methyl ester carboxylesterase